jgi:predicted permease
MGAIEKNLPFVLPPNSPIALNGTVLLLTIALLVPTVLLFSIVPALRLTRIQVDAVLARGARQLGSSFSRRGGQLLIGAEIAIAVVLVTGAGLMIRSFIRVSAIELGFITDGLVTMQVLPLERTAAAHKAYYDQLLQRLRTSPSIASAGLVDNLVLGGGTMYSSATVDDIEISAAMFAATPGYLETIGASVIEGKLPAADAASASRSVVINESAARKFPSGSAIGRELRRAVAPEGPFVVAAVIRDLRHGGPLDIRGIGQPQMFFPLEPSDADLNAPIMAIVRPSSRAPSLGAELRDIAQSIGPPVLVERIRAASDYFDDRVVTPRRRMLWLGLLGGFGLLLALVGVFGMTAYAVTRRTAEIGVRMAFGASPAEVVRTMLNDSAMPILIGVALGIAGSVASARVIRSFLFETDPVDVVTLVAVAFALVTSGCLAALFPAMRASRVDPSVCLRVE